jgi:hypothetical protein
LARKTILIGSPIRQMSVILQQFLLTLSELELSSVEVDYMFIDDNTQEESSRLLANFADSNGRTTIIKITSEPYDHYARDETTHYWKEEQIWKVADMKNTIIKHAMTEGYDHLFLVDSDLVLHPATLEQLVHTGKDIVSCIFWTRWQPNTMEMPQVWLQDEYTQHKTERRGAKLTADMQLRAVKQFHAKLRVPGLYEVGGLGACTLISLNALQAGVHFGEIKSLSFWGEDRHFCVRAQALGFDLFVETTYPSYHIYRISELNGLAAYKEKCRKQNTVLSPKDMNPEQLFEYAYDNIALGYEEAAAGYYARYLEMTEGSNYERFMAFWHSSNCWASLDEREREKEVLLQGINEFDRAELYCRLGLLCMNQENWHEAVIWFKLSIELEYPADITQSPDPTAWTWLPHLQLCVCYDRLGNYQEAMYHNECGLSINPTQPSMLQNRQYLAGKLASL